MPCWIASCGTTIALGRIAPCMNAVTNMPGRRSIFGLGSTARTMNEPVSWLNDGSEKLILPRYGYLIPPGSTTSTS